VKLYHGDTPHRYQRAQDDDGEFDILGPEYALVQSSNGELNRNDNTSIGHLGREETNVEQLSNMGTKDQNVFAEPAWYP
jgi:hypothetical protein